MVSAPPARATGATWVVSWLSNGNRVVHTWARRVTSARFLFFSGERTRPRVLLSAPSPKGVRPYCTEKEVRDGGAPSPAREARALPGLGMWQAVRLPYKQTREL